MSDTESIGVFGEELILWGCFVRQSPRRPTPDQVYKQAIFLLDELRGSQTASLMPIVAVEDGMFAIAALLDEIAMSLPDLRPLWSQNMLQARRFNTNNAGVEFFQRLTRVRQGPKNVLATYIAVLGCGFLGQYGLPGRTAYELNQLRAQLARELGVDADRDIMGGVLKPYRYDQMPAEFLPKEPFYKSVWMGRGLAIVLFVVSAIFFGRFLSLYLHK
ncbi:MAG: DotU family type IV/VI secretion system protein [Polyangiaceae bacterium]